MIKAFALTVFSLSMFTATVAFARPNFDNPPERPRLQSLQDSRYQDQDPDEREERRRSREERGMKRLQQHEWQPGYTMPQHYRGNSYKVEYQQYQLPKPNRQQQWYKINNEFVLIDSKSNNIIQIVKH